MLSLPRPLLNLVTAQPVKFRLLKHKQLWKQRGDVKSKSTNRFKIWNTLLSGSGQLNIDIFQVEVFSSPGFSHCPALNPHLQSRFTLLGNFTVSVLGACFKLFLLHPNFLPQTSSGFFRLVPASGPWHLPFSLQGTLSLISMCLAGLNIPSQTSPPPRGLLGLHCLMPPPITDISFPFYFLPHVYDYQRFLLIHWTGKLCTI